MSINSFTFYRTFLPKLGELTDPVVLSFDNTSFIKTYKNKWNAMPYNFIHSGNFFSQPYTRNPALRTRERILLLQERISNDKTKGLMTLNIPASYDLATPYWLQSEYERIKALNNSFSAALWAKGVAKRPKLLYAGYEVGTYEDALYIFHKSLKSDLRCLSGGFGLFTRSMKYRSLDRLKQFEVLAAFNTVIDEFDDAKFHASGGSSINVLELLAYSNVASADGSSAVLSGLAYGSVISKSGKATRVNRIENWKCGCEFCTSCKRPLNELKASAEARVRHNINVVRDSENEINQALRDNTIEELTENRLKTYDNNDLWKCYEIIKRERPRA